MPPDTPATLSLCECCWTSQDVIFHEVHFLGLTGGKKKSEILLHWKKYVLFFRTYCFSEINYEQSYNIKQKICLVWLNIFWRTTNTDLYSYINNSYVNVMRKKNPTSSPGRLVNILEDLNIFLSWLQILLVSWPQILLVFHKCSLSCGLFHGFLVFVTLLHPKDLKEGLDWKLFTELWTYAFISVAVKQISFLL